MSNRNNNKLFEASLVKEALKQSLIKLDPRILIRNPVMFTVEIGTAIMLGVCIWILTGEKSQGSFAYNFIVFFILLITVLFANFAEAIAEARGKAQAESLRKTRQDTPAKKIFSVGEIYSPKIKIVPSSELQKGDLFICEAGDVIPMDGEIVKGIATIDESAITGESAPVIREAGGDKSSVTGGTKVLSDRIEVRVTTEAGESFLDKMIALVEGASRQKTPNEIALTILLAGFTIIFIIVCVTLKPFGEYANTPIAISAFIALFVCLIPTTIGGLLSAIGIAGMDRALRANVITKSGKAVETAGDLDTLLLDKTGTITIGNRKATNFYPANCVDEKLFIETSVLSSLADETPEGKSIVELAKLNPSSFDTANARFIQFTAETRSSGMDMADGTKVRKGAFDSIRTLVIKAGNSFPPETAEKVKEIASNGGTPLVVSRNNKAMGVIELQDIIKPGIQERFERLRKMGVKTVMVTGDNPLTAKFIANKAGVNDFIAEAKPEDKMNYIRKEQQGGKLVAMMGDGTNDAPALAQADVGVAMNSGTAAAKEAGNMVDLDNDPTKLIEIVEIGKQLLMTRGTLTTFSIANDVAKYFAIVPALFIASIPGLQGMNIMHLHSPESAILSAVIFNAIIIPMLIPLALRGVEYKPLGASALLRRNLLIYGFGGVIIPFIGIKLIDLLISIWVLKITIMKQYIFPAIRLTLVCILVFIVLYPLLIWGIAQAAPAKGEGEPVTVNGRVVGYKLIGQSFTNDNYFNGRPSAVGYNAAGSGGSNKGPSNPEYLQSVKDRTDTFLVHNPTVKRAQIPSDLVTASGSGQDPDISPEAALVQVDRIATSRNISADKVKNLVNKQIEQSLFGPAHVNVLKANIELDKLKAANR